MVGRLTFVVSGLVCAGLWMKPAHADQSAYDKGEALLRQVAAKYQSLETMSGELTEEWSDGGRETTRRARVVLGKPNLARLEYDNPDELVVRDGKRAWRLNRRENRFSKVHADPSVIGPVASDENPIAFFFATGRLTFKPVAVFIGLEDVNGETCQIVEASLSQGRERLAVGPDLLVRRITGKHNGRSFSNTLSNVSCDVPIAGEAFSIQLPAGAQPYDKPSAAVFASTGSSPQDFSLRTFGGAVFRLSETLKQKKAVLVHFWSYP